MQIARDDQCVFIDIKYLKVNFDFSGVITRKDDPTLDKLTLAAVIIKTD